MKTFKSEARTKSPIILIAGGSLAVAAGVFLLLAANHYWASFIPPPSWRYVQWILFFLYTSCLGAVIFIRARQMKISDGPLLWKTAFGCLVFGFGGVEATEGALAFVSKYLPGVNVSYCAAVTEHNLPIETFLPKTHPISVRMPFYNHNTDVEFYYNHRMIEIDGVRAGDSVWITGKRSSTGIYVDGISPAQCH